MKKSTWMVVAVINSFIGGGLVYRHFAQEVDSRGATRLMRALEENDADKFGKLLEEIEDIDARDKSGQTALFYAARHASDVRPLHKLIVAGADPFAQNKHGDTPLMTAARHNPSTAVIMTLAKQGGLSERQAENKSRALLVAARHNTLPVIKTLLIANAQPGYAGADGKTAAQAVLENEQLTEVEKADLRQAMLVLEILDAREKWLASVPNPAAKKVTSPKPATPKTPAPKPVTPVAPKPAASTPKSVAPVMDTPTVASNAPAPQEKQMPVEEPTSSVLASTASK